MYSLHSCGILNTAAVCVSSQKLSVYEQFQYEPKHGLFLPPLSELFISLFSGLIYTDLRDMHWGILHQQQQCHQRSLTKRVRFCKSFAHSWTLKSSSLVNTS